MRAAARRWPCTCCTWWSSRPAQVRHHVHVQVQGRRCPVGLLVGDGPGDGGGARLHHLQRRRATSPPSPPHDIAAPPHLPIPKFVVWRGRPSCSCQHHRPPSPPVVQRRLRLRQGGCISVLPLRRRLREGRRSTFLDSCAEVTPCTATLAWISTRQWRAWESTPVARGSQGRPCLVSELGCVLSILLQSSFLCIVGNFGSLSKI